MERPSTSKPRGVCKFYETPRGCFAGKNCKFLHGEDERLTPYDKNKTCRYYRAGYCKRGDRCWFLHVDGSEEPSPPGSDAECIICYDKPVTYGLMDGCSHVLCVQCIRQWRHPNNRTDDAETTNISCPYCRVPSYFVTPSSQFFPKGHPRRAEIVAQYKASMARVPCRHFQNSPANRRHCPFGRNCFYQHLNADGTPYIFPENSNVSTIYAVHKTTFPLVRYMR
ncbi:hypothetical protein BDM02DRAFT_3093667 [Thelephora ganbajun]|uniref:Uncharacterized protein n=1 Tax=Thelephora ganbajun TaxID=370292 RepID=A0ACB6ZLB7_THEGA|nr:hypothetical protein BDM02DRAFT_3093667 [Thelephora ganbajun]